MISLEKIDDVELYLKNFDILNFVESIKVIPIVWYQSIVGKDDCWGVNIGFEPSTYFDAYFLLSGHLFHEKLGEVWSNSGYTSGHDQANEIKNKGMLKEWAIAKKVQGEICFNVLFNYSPSRHKEQLLSVNNLTDNELNELSKLYLRKNIDHIKIYISSQRCVACTKTNYTIQENLDINGIIGLVRKGLLKEMKFQIVRNEQYSEKISQDNFKELLKKDNMER